MSTHAPPIGPDRPYELSHLDALESEAVFVFREVAAELEKPVTEFKRQGGYGTDDGAAPAEAKAEAEADTAETSADADADAVPADDSNASSDAEKQS